MAVSSKVFIVTGASRGLGAAIARYLLKESHKVVVTARSQEKLESFKTEFPGQVEVVAGDITKSEITDSLTTQAVKAFGKLDGIVICHGVLDPQRLENDTVENYKYIYDINVFSALAVAKAGLVELRKTKGTLLWISSGASEAAYAAWSAYGSSKAAVNSISAHFNAEEKDIISVSVAPGKIDTDMQAVIRSKGEGNMDEAAHKSFVDEHARGDLLRPEQPGNVLARFMIDPDTSLSGKYTRWNSPDFEKYQGQD